MSESTKPDHDEGLDIVTEKHTKTQKPSMYKVILLNDDYTTMEFVIHVLESVFNKSKESATAVMLEVHQKGQGLCGVYTREIAETKTHKVLQLARNEGFPLQCMMEVA